jgi:hypothetical protein
MRPRPKIIVPFIILQFSGSQFIGYKVKETIFAAIPVKCPVRYEGSDLGQRV